MSLELFDTVLEQLAPYTREIACHVMGDPLTLSNLKSYLNAAHTHGFRVTLTTSGFLIPRHDNQTLLHPAIRQLNISLNSYNKNSTRLSLEAYLDPIIALCGAKLRQTEEMFINLRLWNLDEESSDREFNDAVFARLNAAFGTQLTAPDLSASRPDSVRLERKVLLHFDRYFTWPSLKNDLVGDGYCHGLVSQIGILATGDVVPCCLDGEGVMRLGNLSHTPLAAILASPRACAITKGFKNAQAVEELCRRCSYKSRFALNPDITKTW